MSNGFGFMIESLVAFLLLLTIGYCIVLNNRLKRLKADEQALKATISELIMATEIAERAVAGLKTTARECDETLGERLRTAERSCAELNRYIKAGDVLIKQLYRIVAAGRPVEGESDLVAAAPSGPDADPDAVLDAAPELRLAAEPAAAAAGDIDRAFGSEAESDRASGVDLAALEADLSAAPASEPAAAPGAGAVVASLPDARAVAAAAQALATRARERLGALAA